MSTDAWNARRNLRLSCLDQVRTSSLQNAVAQISKGSCRLVGLRAMVNLLPLRDRQRAHLAPEEIAVPAINRGGCSDKGRLWI